MQWTRLAPTASVFAFGDGQSDADRQATARGICKALDHRLEDGDITDYAISFNQVLVEFPEHGNFSSDSLAQDLARANPVPAKEVSVRKVEVHYNGPDLDEVAKHAELSRSDVIALHCEPIYEVEMLGFSPGFPYLAGLDPRLHTPRRHAPRPEIPVGSVAIGGGHTGIYSVASPGGWNLIGMTTLRLFRPEDSAHPFLLTTGDLLRFIPTGPNE